MQEDFQISRRTKIVLSKISFSGATLGRDYEITFNVAGQTASVKVDMNRRREALLNREIFYVPEVPEARRLPLRIDILEKDEVFDDAGSLNAELVIDYPSQESKRSSLMWLFRGEGGKLASSLSPKSP